MPSLRILDMTAHLWGLRLPLRRLHGPADPIGPAAAESAARPHRRPATLPRQPLAAALTQNKNHDQEDQP